MTTMNLDAFREKLYSLLAEPVASEDKLELLLSFYTLYRSSLPLFPEDQKTHRVAGKKPVEFLYQGKNFLYIRHVPSHLRLEEHFVDAYKFIGDTWLFKNDRSEGRPIPEKMAQITLGAPKDFPAIWVDKAGEYCYATDGNHRIYAAYLLGRPVKISFWNEMAVI